MAETSNPPQAYPTPATTSGKTGIGNLLRPIRDFLLPSVCLACDRSVAVQGCLCATCWNSVRHVEQPWCEATGAPFSYDLGKGALSASAIANPPTYDRARSAVLYDDVAKRLIQSLKFSDRTDLAPWLAASMVHFVQRSQPDMLENNPLILPVPLHRRRLVSRRFNQSAELARNFAKQTSGTYRHDLLHRIRPTRQQVGLGAKERAKNVNGAFRVPLESKIHVKGASIILVDDVFTTGATLEACARALRRAGAKTIDCLTYARAFPD